MQQLPAILTPDVGLIFWMLAAFLVVFVLLARYGFPVIISMVNERKTYIDESLQKAREANEKLANIKAESDAILKAAHEQQAQIIKEAMATRESILQEARDKAQEQSRKLIEEAKAQAAIEKDNALREVRGIVADVSVGVAQKLMRQQLERSEEQQNYIIRLLDEVIPAQK